MAAEHEQERDCLRFSRKTAEFNGNTNSSSSSSSSASASAQIVMARREPELRTPASSQSPPPSSSSGSSSPHLRTGVSSRPIDVPRLALSPNHHLLHPRRATEPQINMTQLSRHNTSPSLSDMASSEGSASRTHHRTSNSSSSLNAHQLTSPNHRHDLTRSGSWKWEDLVISQNGMQRGGTSHKNSPSSASNGQAESTPSSSSSPTSASSTASSSSTQFTPETTTMTSMLSPISDIRLSDIEELQLLGSGAMGTVKKVRHTPTGRIYAMKVLILNSSNRPKNILAEVNTLSESRSPYIVGFYQAFCMESKIYLLIEYMNMGSLKNLKDSYYRRLSLGRVDGPMPEKLLAYIANQVLLGLHYLHDTYRAVHRDLKPANILINSRGEVKISDFGMTGRIDDDGLKDSFQGTMTYMSPERLLGEDHSFSSDIWSLGVCLAECALGCVPFSSALEDRKNSGNVGFLDLLLEIQNTKLVKLSEKDYGPQFHDFIWKCMCHQANDRPSAKELLNHPLFQLHPPSDFDMRLWLKKFYPYDGKPRSRNNSISSFDSPRSFNSSPRLGPEMNLPQQDTVVPELQIPPLLTFHHRFSSQRRSSDAMLSRSPPLHESIMPSPPK